MEKKEIFRKVGMIMAELNDQYQYLSEKPENLNELELELFLANSNFLTDHIEILRKLNGSISPATNIHQTQQADISPSVRSDSFTNSGPVEEVKAVNQPEATQPAKEQWELSKVEEASPEVEDVKEESRPELPENKSEGDIALPLAEQKEVEQPTEVPISETVQEVKEQEVVKEIVIPEKTVNVEAPVSVEEPAPAPTINDIISAQVNSSTVAAQFTNKPIGDLKTIINLNDKLLFIKDLFNGYSLAYSEAIELVNRFDNFESADNFLKVNYASKNNWTEKQQTVDKLYDILKRRFAK